MTMHPDQDLRTTLHRIADSAPPVQVRDDLWQRGRSARRRGQVLAIAAALALLVSVGGIALMTATSDREARTASSEEVPGGAIPSRIEDISADLEQTSVEDLDVGRASAAFNAENGDAVVLTAVDGRPHRLNLVSRDDDSIALALSPDGTRLAFQEDPGISVTYLAVLDLTTGRTQRSIVVPDVWLDLRELRWSPDGTWISWVANASNAADGAHIGRFGLTDGTNDFATARGNVPDAAIGNDGTIVFSRADGGLFRIDDGTTRRISAARGVGAGAFSPDGRFVALRSSPDPVSYTLDTSTQRLLEHPFPADTFTDGYVLPQGWLDDRLQVLLVQDPVDRDSAELVITTPEVDQTSTWRRSVGVVEYGPARTLSLAVDLIPDLDGTSSQELTHDFRSTTIDNPLAWTGIELSVLIGLGVAAAIGVLLGLRWLWRRLWARFAR